MWIFLSVIVVCATVLYWSSLYLIPVKAETPTAAIQEIDDKDQPINFDDVIAEIYDRLEEGQ